MSLLDKLVQKPRVGENPLASEESMHELAQHRADAAIKMAEVVARNTATLGVPSAESNTPAQHIGVEGDSTEQQIPVHQSSEQEDVAA